MYINAEDFHEDPFGLIRRKLPTRKAPLATTRYKGNAFYVYLHMWGLLGEEATNYFFIRIAEDYLSKETDFYIDGDGEYDMGRWLNAATIDDLSHLGYSRFHPLRTHLKMLLEKEPTEYAPDEIEYVKNVLIKEIYK